MSVQVTDKDNGYEALMKRSLGKALVTVGVHEEEGQKPKTGDSGKEESDVTVAEVALFHEYGLGVPQRSWLRGFVDEHQDELKKMMSASARAVQSGALTEQVAMDRFGAAVVGMIKRRIFEGIEPELKEETRIRKAKLTGGSKDTPLVLWSQLVSSITHEVRMREKGK